MQMICALLVFGGRSFPAPLPSLSPWLDWLGEEIADVVARLEAQDHRRIIKTHTPLDGLPLTRDATYIVVARDPLDAAVSLYHQGANLDRTRMAALTGTTVPSNPGGPAPRPDLDVWLTRWIETEADPLDSLDSLPGVVHHLTDAWQRRAEPNVVLVRYADLLADRSQEMRRLADRLAIPVGEGQLSALVDEAGFEAMAARADELAPDPGGILLDRAAFFRRGRTGDGFRAVAPDVGARYRARLRALAPPDLLAWLDGEAPATS